MVLADTSVWVRHFREGFKDFSGLLEHGGIFMHPFVLGELACGRLNPRKEILDNLGGLQMIEVATEREVLAFIDAHRLMGAGLGYIDMHLLASSKLAGAPIWTLDSALQKSAQSLGICYKD